jgi:hypothetical protein
VSSPPSPAPRPARPTQRRSVDRRRPRSARTGDRRRRRRAGRFVHRRPRGSVRPAPSTGWNPTQTEAERLAADAACDPGLDKVLHFPAWETLPFERVSPGVETMGQRLRVLHRLTSDRPPSLVVASARALIQRIDPACRHRPDRGAPWRSGRPGRTRRTFVMLGYRREGQVEHRGEVAVRGSIVDVYPSTADAPVRIDLWGDEVDRLTEFAVADQRSTEPVDRRVSTRVASSGQPTHDGHGQPSSSQRSRGGASSGIASPTAPSSTAWSRGCRGSSRASIS